MSCGLGDLDDDLLAPTPSNTPVGVTDEDSSEDEQSPKKHPRPTKKNPFNGLVEGVRRGNTRHSECCSGTVLIEFRSWSHSRHRPTEIVTNGLPKFFGFYPTVQSCNARPGLSCE